MPLVRIDYLQSEYLQGRPAGFGVKAGEIVYRTMLDTINVPPRDNFQIITEHTRESLVYDPDYLDFHRTDGVVIIQITLNEGRSLELKKAFYQKLAERLHQELGVRLEDVFISLVEVKKENWSFGNGVAQYASP